MPFPFFGVGSPATWTSWRITGRTTRQSPTAASCKTNISSLCKLDIDARSRHNLTVRFRIVAIIRTVFHMCNTRDIRYSFIMNSIVTHIYKYTFVYIWISLLYTFLSCILRKFLKFFNSISISATDPLQCVFKSLINYSHYWESSTGC